jgi:hypothetical protein
MSDSKPATVDQLTRNLGDAAEIIERLAAEHAKLRQACEGLLKHAASKAFWEQQSVDHWDKPGPHNAAIKALKAIAVAESALTPATEGEPSPSPPPVPIRYTNWRGKTRVRRIVPIRLRFAANEWHPEPQWLLDAIDVGKQAERSFAVAGIHEWGFATAGEGGGAC